MDIPKEPYRDDRKYCWSCTNILMIGDKWVMAYNGIVHSICTECTPLYTD